MKLARLAKKWVKMLSGKSVFHATQGKGKAYSTTEIKGYYNDLTCKVCDSTLLDKNGIPYNITIVNVKTYFPITIFQYGLGLYDLYLLKKEQVYLDDFLKIAEWAVREQKENGMWDCMGKLNNRVAKTQSSMCQSEGASVLLRAYVATNKKKYYQCAKKAIDFMLESVHEGGTTFYEDEDVVFEEYVTDVNLAVLNGWIFSIFGLYDLMLVNKESKYERVFDGTIATLKKYLKRYDRGFWSNYDIHGTITSPFYHELHINLLGVLAELTDDSGFNKMARKWNRYGKSRVGRYRAMTIKLFQKLGKDRLYDSNTGLAK